MTLDTQVETQPRPKDLSIQSLRGLAVLLMVAGHVIGAGALHGMAVGNTGGWRTLYVGLQDIRMPLFTVLSGFVYAARPVGAVRDLPNLVRGKSRRLLLPLLTVSPLLFGLWAVTGGYQTEFWRIFVYAFAHLWFLQSIFLVFLVVGVLDAFGALTSRIGWMIATAVSAAVWVVVPVPPNSFFTIDGAVHFLPFFLLGYGMQRHRVLDLRRLPLLAAIAVCGVVWLVRMWAWGTGQAVDPYVWRAMVTVIGFLGVTILYSLRRYMQSSWLVWIGGFSFTIYLLHMFAFTIMPPIIRVTGAGPNHLYQFTATMIVVVSVPIIFELTAGRLRLVRTLLLGQKWVPNARKAPALERVRA